MIIMLYLLFCMLAVICFDVTRFIIPNWLVGSLLLLYPLAVWLAPNAVDWQNALIGMLIVFAVGYVVFSKGWMGGGDIKLIVVCSLWVGMGYLMEFFVTFAILGGVFSILLFVGRKILTKTKYKKLPRILREGEPVPYGVAIALAFLLMIKAGQVPPVAAYY